MRAFGHHCCCWILLGDPLLLRGVLGGLSFTKVPIASRRVLLDYFLPSFRWFLLCRNAETRHKVCRIFKVEPMEERVTSAPCKLVSPSFDHSKKRDMPVSFLQCFKVFLVLGKINCPLQALCKSGSRLPLRKGLYPSHCPQILWPLLRASPNGCHSLFTHMTPLHLCPSPTHPGQSYPFPWVQESIHRPPQPGPSTCKYGNP